MTSLLWLSEHTEHMDMLRGCLRLRVCVRVCHGRELVDVMLPPVPLHGGPQVSSSTSCAVLPARVQAL